MQESCVRWFQFSSKIRIHFEEMELLRYLSHIGHYPNMLTSKHNNTIELI